jgi:hypothetical protein
MPESIQEWLVSQGFSIDADNQYFRKYSPSGDLTKIPVSALVGRSLAVFKILASKEGWVTDSQPKRNPEIQAKLDQLQKKWGITSLNLVENLK